MSPGMERGAKEAQGTRKEEDLAGEKEGRRGRKEHRSSGTRSGPSAPPSMPSLFWGLNKEPLFPACISVVPSVQAPHCFPPVTGCGTGVWEAGHSRWPFVAASLSLPTLFLSRWEMSSVCCVNTGWSPVMEIVKDMRLLLPPAAQGPGLRPLPGRIRVSELMDVFSHTTHAGPQECQV